MKLFSKLVGKSKNGSGSKKSPNGSQPNSRQNSSNERKIPEFVGGEGDLDVDESEENSNSYSSPIPPPANSVRLTDEEKGMILSDDLSISRPEDNDPNFPTNRDRSHSRNRARDELLEYEETKSSGYNTPVLAGSPVRASSVNSLPVPPPPLNDNVRRLYQAQSDHNLNRIESFRSAQGGVAVSQISKSNSQSFHFPAPAPAPAPYAGPPPSFSPQEIMEINRLMSIGYSYETALAMMGINPSPSSMMSPPAMPVPLPVPVPVPMMVPPAYYAPHPMMASPYQSFYGAPMPYPMPPQPTPPSSSFRSGRDFYDEGDMMLAIQRSIEEEDRRKRQMTEEEMMVKEAVERANERAVQIALQRSFEEQYGPGSYQRFQEEQARAMASSVHSFDPQLQNQPQSQPQPQPQAQVQHLSQRINRQGTFDFNMIHNYGSVEIDEEANPLREALEEQFEQENNRPGVYYHSPSRPYSNNSNNHRLSSGTTNTVNHVPSFAQDDSFYEVAAER